MHVIEKLKPSLLLNPTAGQYSHSLIISLTLFYQSMNMDNYIQLSSAVERKTLKSR